MPWLHPTQSIVAKDTHRFRVVNCGRRWGKTSLSSEEIKGKMVAKPCRVAYFATTYAQARDIAWSMLKKELDPIITKCNESAPLEIVTKTLKGGESKITLRGWENVETARGQAFDFLVLDEVASMRNFWSNWHEILRPTLTDTKGEAMFIGTPKGFNHFYDLYNEEGKDSDYKSFHFTSYDNPYIDKDEIEKARKELSEDRFAQEYLADFRKTEGLVFKEFERTIHVYKDEPKGIIEILGGIDFGYTNPCAILTVKRDGDNRYFVDNEWYETSKTEVQIAEYAAACKFNKCYPDPESPSAIRELENKHVNVYPVIKEKDSIKSGIEKMRELFKQKRLFINARCKNLIYELETYSYPEKKEMANAQENPIKENDHAIDALRYVLSMQASENRMVKPYTKPKWQPSSPLAGI